MKTVFKTWEFEAPDTELRVKVKAYEEPFER